jgi:hypothetical protein
MRPFCGSIHLIHVPQNGVVIKFGGEPKFEFQESPLGDDEGGAGGLNHTPCVVKPLVTMSMYLESCVTFVMNLKL